MLSSTRRRFIIRAATAGAAGHAFQVLAQTAPVDEASETAVALGYKHDTKLVDAKKYPKHEPSQHCGNCSFWQAKPTDAWGGCAMFGRKAQVANAGWCQAWVKAAG